MPMNPPTHNPANVLPISSGTSFNESERSDQARRIANINVVTKTASRLPIFENSLTS